MDFHDTCWKDELRGNAEHIGVVRSKNCLYIFSARYTNLPMRSPLDTPLRNKAQIIGWIGLENVKFNET